MLVKAAEEILKTAVEVEVVTVPTQVFVYVAPNCRGVAVLNEATDARVLLKPVLSEFTLLFVVLNPELTTVDKEATWLRTVCKDVVVLLICVFSEIFVLTISVFNVTNAVLATSAIVEVCVLNDATAECAETTPEATLTKLVLKEVTFNATPEILFVVDVLNDAIAL